MWRLTDGGKTTGKYGPELVVGVTKRNAFRGAELLNVRLHGAYEWTTKRNNDAGTTGRINDYQYGAEVSLQFPRFLNPFKNTSSHTSRTFAKTRSCRYCSWKTSHAEATTHLFRIANDHFECFNQRY